jgi:SAM-dependent methyltransferase
MKCPICQSCKTTLFLERFGVPVHQNLLCSSEELARNIKRGSLSMAICEECGFVFNQAFDVNLLSYGKDYDNTQICSAMFQAYIDSLVHQLINERGVVNKTVVEVGCGKGSFLKSLCLEGRNCGIGFDPSYVGPSILMDGRLRFERSFYGPGCESIPADVVICRHVIEHVSDPVNLLKAVKQALRKSPAAQVFFETPDLDWILKNHVFWDFFYEHCSYFTEQSLTSAFEIAGFEVKSICNVFQGQYLWSEAKLGNRQNHNIRRLLGRIPVLAKQFAERERERVLIQRWQKRLKELRSLGRVAIWGAGAKGVTFANLLDPHCEWIDCVVDLNPNKQGRFVPGTGHPIVSYQDLPKRNVATAILMNPNYREENQFLLHKARIKLNLVNHEEI